MKLQVKFKIENPDGSLKNVTKTFSKINESAGNENFKNFAVAYASLIEASDVEVYLVTVEEL